MKNKKDIIIEKAKMLFGKYGYGKTSLNDIANSTKFGIGTIYYYFSSKEEIFAEIFKQTHDLFLDNVNEIYHSNASIIDKLVEIFTFPSKFLDTINLNIFTEINEFPQQIMHDCFALKNNIVERVKTITLDLLDQGQESGEIRSDIDCHNFAKILFYLFRYVKPVEYLDCLISHVEFLSQNKKIIHGFFTNHLKKVEYNQNLI